ncbi:MoxR family ATPase [Puniceibacterium sp. IMCC21224]|uniref:AAA family ATPase n=1 Tax=Puniceibacterium sp. IMCC21224 TaxID=1618204 RepID=UPI00064DD645|nr:AAA family ATPase [Puniceibacterium sp. IMCC21224]KMK65190.1 MoxR-like ATPase [Puniceibacterium sp. IMCC21224]
MDALTDNAPGGVAALSRHLAEGLIGHEVLIERLLIGVLAGGHLLIEGAPGLAKTRAVKRLAGAMDAAFARIQCTPDLMPADLTGTPVFRPQTGTFEFVPGPVFHNLVLVDEINRAPPKVQSALLEAMAEGQVTSGNETMPLPDPFLVVATQNPIEHDGTFPLPEAQLDRFLMHVVLDLPDAATERRILDLVEAEGQGVAPAPMSLSLEDVRAARKAAMAVHLSEPLRDYIVRLVTATRADPYARDIDHAVSPRGSLALASAAKARAYLHNRDFAMPEDVADVAGDALAHRMVMTWRAVAEGRTARALIADVLRDVEAL